ncbi:hypothetical protein QBC44DRAFT_326245 [Cladorrhinum sp. PSN332]|nr:hypothetical protein QBC44DRAFT_326245 [Cladorrhinum sp. PSN332]
MDALYFDTFEDDEPSDERSSLEELGLSSLDGLEHLLCYDCKTRRPRRLCQRCHAALAAAKRSGKLFKSALETATSDINPQPCHGQAETAEPLHRLGLRRLSLSQSAPSTPAVTRPSRNSRRVSQNYTSRASSASSITRERDTIRGQFGSSARIETVETFTAESSSPWESSDWGTRHDTRFSSFWETSFEVDLRWEQHPRPNQPAPQRSPPPRPHRQQPTRRPPPSNLPPAYSQTAPVVPRICTNPYCLPLMHIQNLIPPSAALSPPFPLTPQACTHQTCLSIYRDRLRRLGISNHYHQRLRGSIDGGFYAGINCPDPFYCHVDEAWDDLGLDQPWFVRELCEPRRCMYEVLRGNTWERRERREVGQTMLVLGVGRVMFPRRMWVVDRVSVGLVKWFVKWFAWPWRYMVDTVKEVVGMILGEDIKVKEEDEGVD